ncbi:MAG: AAA family ATPase [Alphaproteobacteria bacterium]|nr:AAA family ATPase [Alphaproteobacteria bacterium]
MSKPSPTGQAKAPALAADAPRPRILPAPITAIASGKGGVGKTWLSITLSCIWGRQGRKTLLVDCDLGLANADVQLNVRPQADLNSVLKGWIDLDAAATPIMGGPGREGGFDLIAGHSGSGALAAARAEDAARIVEGVRRMSPHYDRLIMDVSAGVDPTVQRFCRGADKLVVVTTEEPPAMMDAYALIKLTKLGGTHEPPWIVVNMAENRVRGRKVYDQLAAACEQHLGLRPKLAGIIQRDPRVSDSIRAQLPIAVRHPQSQALEDALRVAEALNGE